MPQAVKASLLFSCVLHAACSSAPSFEPLYEACASDENWITFDDYEKTMRVTTSGDNLPVWSAPMMGATVAAQAAVVFQWQPTAKNAGAADGDATCPQFQPAALPGTLQIDHLPPVSGTVYDLHFAVDGNDVYRVVTTRQRAGVTMSTFAGWSGKTVTATLYSAKMLINSIAEGPYQAAPLQFQVTP